MIYEGWFMEFNATFNNISVISRRSFLLVGETGEPGENTDLLLVYRGETKLELL
jgi:hypothetical protein